MTVRASPPSLEEDVAYEPPPDIGLDLIHVDDDLVVVNKPAGLLSVPGRGADRADCMAARVQARFSDAMIVHRLDMATSGLLVFGRGLAMQRALSEAFAARAVDKRYEAVVQGCVPNDAGDIDLPLITDWPRRPRQVVCFERGKPSLTRYRVLSRSADEVSTRLSLEPVTGRSHQLRVHLLALGHPIVGDPLYGPQVADGGQACERMCLHAVSLSLTHPREGRVQTWVSPAPF